MAASAVQPPAPASAPSPVPVPRPAAPKPPALGRAPGPRGPFAGLKLIRPATSLGYLRETFNRYGDVVHYRLGPIQSFLIAHPAGIKHILQDNHRNYRKSLDYQFLKSILGEGLVTSEGELWLRQRRLIQPAFHRERVMGFGAIMVDATMEMLESWDKLAAQGCPFDVSQEMMRLTLKIVGKALLSMDLTNEAGAIGANLAIANDRFSHFDLGMLLPFLPTRRNREFARAAGAIKGIVDGIIAARKRENRDRGDLLSMLLAARDEETGAAMEAGQLRDEILTLILAGHETTATALSWTFYLLAQHPEVRDKLEAELRAVLGGRPPTVADLRNLTYTGMVIDESMRLYPPVWAIGRSPIEDDEIGGYRIPKNATVILSQYVTHRHPAFWDEPDRFDPERFSAARSQERPTYAYFPFAGGPRKCIGYLFALTEANLVLSAIAQRYRLHLVPDHPVETHPLVTLRPRYGIKVTLEKVGAAARN